MTRNRGDERLRKVQQGPPPEITVPPSGVSRDVLLAAMSDRTLDSAALNVVYTRP